MVVNLLSTSLDSKPPAFLSSNTCPLREVAARLPATGWQGLEVALQSPSDQLDFHVAVKPNAFELENATQSLISNHSHGDLIRFFQRATLDHALLQPSIAYFVLEYDVKANGRVLPALFLAFQPNLGRAHKDYFVRTHCKELGVAESQLNSLSRCFDLLVNEEEIRHLGFMLSRQDNPIRVNIRNVSVSRLPILLDQLGCEQELSAEVAVIANQYSRYVDRFILCVDLTQAGVCNASLELTLVDQPGKDGRYARLLHNFAVCGLVSADTAMELMGWPETAQPGRELGQWPSHLVSELILSSEKQLITIERYISHFKLQYKCGSLEAKAYLGVRKVDLNEPSGMSDVVSGLSAQSEAPEHRLRDYLLSQRHQSGLWRDYPGFSFGESDEWLSAYIACALARSSDCTKSQRAATEVWGLLAGCQRSDGGWGWNAWLSADADSTAWSMQLAQLVGEDTSTYQQATAFLNSHLQGDGGYSTYLPDVFLRYHPNQAALPNGFHSWCRAHVCVTSAVAMLDHVSSSTIHYIIEHQYPDGYWAAYWWPSDEFATSLAVKALAKAGDRSKEAIAKAKAWASSRFDGRVYVCDSKGAPCVFATANLLSILLNAEPSGKATAMEKSVLEWILGQQNANGGYSGASAMYVNPEAIPIRQEYDSHGLHTTATVLNVINDFRAFRS